MDHLTGSGVHTPTRQVKLLRIGNIISFLLATGIHLAAILVFSPSIGTIIDDNFCFFTPEKSFIYVFWGLYYLSAFGFVFYAQLIDEEYAQRIVKGVIGPWFIVSNLLLVGWVRSWLAEDFDWAFLLSIINSAIAAFVHRKLFRFFPLYSLPIHYRIANIWLIFVPFSILVANWFFFVIYTGFLALYNFDGYMDGYIDGYVATVFLVIYAIIGWGWIGFGWFTRGNRDGFFGISAAWLFSAVAFQQRDIFPFSALAGILSISMFGAIFIVFLRDGGSFTQALYSNRDSTAEEREPLTES
ncbi:7272_t:CDS:2 [Paraglomus occultum]|uniref:7272_t:CDS:1 n=1 Tax=Paraglomus occultum TaxID=144539 RepID=A0A9N9C197_9GLOM|nr:7272_t:CDS:2 [Paraglomus occultum]